MIEVACASHGIGEYRELIDLSQESGAEAAKVEPGRSRVMFGMGGSYWHGIGDVTTKGGSTVDPGAFSLQLGFEHAFDDRKSPTWGVGIDLGLSFSDVDGPSRSTGLFTSEEDATATVWWATPSANLYFPSGEGVTLIARAGLGYYHFELNAAERFLFLPNGTRTVITDGTFGGFVGAAFEIDTPWPNGLGRVDYKLHFVGFDGGSDVEPPGTKFDGLMHTLLLTFGWRG